MPKKRMQLGVDGLERDYLLLKRALQCAHIYKKVSMSVVRNAGLWVSFKWGKNANYLVACEIAGLEVEKEE